MDPRCSISYVNVVLIIKIPRTSRLRPLFHSKFLCTMQSLPSTCLAELPTHMALHAQSIRVKVESLGMEPSAL
jgi:hypothetical protein